jgi:hypothetical protein
MKTIWPWSGFMSFNPLKAQIELACVGAPVLLPEPEKGAPGVPEGPATSPAKAAVAPAPATAAAQGQPRKTTAFSFPYLPLGDGRRRPSQQLRPSQVQNHSSDACRAGSTCGRALRRDAAQLELDLPSGLGAMHQGTRATQ